MQPEGELDDVGDALVGHALALLVFECVGVAARCQKALLEMLDTNNAEMLGRNRLAVPLHRRKQFGNAVAIDLIDTEEVSQRLVRTAYLGEYSSKPNFSSTPGHLIVSLVPNGYCGASASEPLDKG